MRSAVYAGSFDPVTKGHLDLIERASKMFDTLYVAVGINPNKKPLFETSEKLDLLRQVTEGIPNVVVDSFQGLLIRYCQEKKATAIVRGLRALSDFEAELALALANFDQDSNIETIFLPTHPQFSFVSSSTVKELAKLGGNLSTYLSPAVLRAIKDKFK